MAEFSEGGKQSFTEPSNPANRWIILLSGVALLASLGSVYAWSFFTRPLQEAYGWSNFQTGLIFSLAVAGLGFVALYTGPYVSKLGGRHLMKRSAKFFIAGNFLAAFGLFLGGGVLGPVETPWINWLSYIVLLVGYGVIGGIGLGTGYVTAVSTVSGWFPDKKGLATGMIVMGFGLGALFMSKVFGPIAMSLASDNLPLVFFIIAIFYTVIMFIACNFIYSPSGVKSKNHKKTKGEIMEHGLSVRVRLWSVCFLYSVAGLGIISLLSPLMQDLQRAANPGMSAAAMAAAGATLIAWASIGNSVGRLFWAGLSDYLGRVNTFMLFMGTASLSYLLLPGITSPFLFTLVIIFAISTYGGGFGTIPALISDMYGSKRMSAMHGLVLTGWATAGLTAAPIFGLMYDALPGQAANIAFYICAVSLALATLMVFTLKGLHKECVQEVEADSAQPILVEEVVAKA